MVELMQLGKHDVGYGFIGAQGAFADELRRVVIEAAVVSGLQGTDVGAAPCHEPVLAQVVAIVLKQLTCRPSRDAHKAYAHLQRYGGIGDAFHKVLLAGAGCLAHLVSGARQPQRIAADEHLGDIADDKRLAIDIPVGVVARNLQKLLHRLHNDVVWEVMGPR